MRTLIIRFSSFGDIFQALEAAKHIKSAEGNASTAKIDWLVRSDFARLLENQTLIDHVISFDRKFSVFELVQLSWQLALTYDRVYDAHSNLRSFIVRNVIRLRWLLGGALGRSIIVRPKDRIRRWLFFRLRLLVLPKPFRGAESFLRPLRAWYPDLKFQFETPSWTPATSAPEANRKTIFPEFRTWAKQKPGVVIAFAPSAAWPNKRWPVERWLKLAELVMAQNSQSRFLLLGGPEDSFLNEIELKLGPDVVFNAVGKSSLLESASLLSLADGLVANDTGLLHVADRLTLPSVGIIGPTAFGYPSSPFARVAEVELSCKPCSKDGRDKCTNSTSLQCLKLVSPENVANILREALADSRSRKGSPNQELNQ